jgi:hypothetical protein
MYSPIISPRYKQISEVGGRSVNSKKQFPHLQLKSLLQEIPILQHYRFHQGELILSQFNPVSTFTRRFSEIVFILLQVSQ